MSSRFAAAILLALAPLAAPAREPVLRYCPATGEQAGITAVQCTRPGPATRYDADADRIVDVLPGIPRYEARAGHPAGRDRGVLVERSTVNFLVQSSFEQMPASWQSEGRIRVAVTNTAFHGNGAVVVRGRAGMWLHAAVTPLPEGARIRGTGAFGSLSVYCRADEAEVRRSFRPVAFALEGDQRGANLIHHIKVEPMVGSTWVRVVGRFQLLRPGTAYRLGFIAHNDVPLVLDAAQFEFNNLPWTASSYIPTGDAPARRGVEYLKVVADTFPMTRGSITFWLYVTNPFGRVGYVFVHGPAANADRLYVTGSGTRIGSRFAKWAKPLLKEDVAGRWHQVALTWDGTQAIAYLDGHENGEDEGPFEYDGLAAYGGHFLLGSNGNDGDCGAEGIISDVRVWDDVLSAAEMQALWETGEPAAASVGTGPVSEGVPVAFTLPRAGRTSVGIYDTTGVLRRQLVLGELKEAGPHRVPWDGRDDAGALLDAGSYEFRGAVNDLSAVWKETVGNSGQPPWGPTIVRGGMFKSLAAVGDDIVVMNPLAEGNHGCQRLDPTGQVVWTSEIDPVYAYMTALAADEQYVYIVGLIRNEKDARGQLYREVLWRLEAASGKLAPWGKQNVLDLNEPRVAPPGRKFFDRYYNGAARSRHPLPGFEVHDIEVRDGTLYVPFFRENAIRTVDVGTGAIGGFAEGIVGPKGLAVTDTDVLVASGAEVIRYRLTGERVGPAVSGLAAPYEVEADAQGNLLVTDLGDAQQVKVFAPDGKPRQAFGLPRGGLVKDGSLARLFASTGIAVDRQGRTVVADFGNGRIVYFDGAGRQVQVAEATGFGGLDGGVSFLPGDPTRLFMSNVFVFGTRINGNIVAYKTGARGGAWETQYRWSDITPVYSQEPLYARRLPNGRTYLFLLSRNPSWFELHEDGRLEFCGALLHPLDYRVYVLMQPQVKEDAEALGLLDAKGLPRCRATWIDGNRNGRMEEGEVAVREGETKPFYTVNDACVEASGALCLKEYLTSTYWRFPLEGFDAAGNPLYAWKSAQKIWDLADWPELQGPRWMLVANETDSDGGMYFSHLKGLGPCLPTHVRLLKFDRDGRFRWNVGRKARGLKDKPGEFMSVTCIAGVNRGIVYILEYEGRVDLYTTDGLYLATLLSGVVDDNSPYANWGENFAGDVVEDAQSGDVYVLINTHNYRLPYFKVEGLDTVHRFDGVVTLTASARADLARVAAAKPEVHTAPMMHFHALGGRAIAVDGDLSDWPDRPEARAAFLDERRSTHGAGCRAAFDAQNLYLAFKVADPTPAVNKRKSVSVLWDDDCVETYISPHTMRGGQWQAGDMTVHFAATEATNRIGAGLLTWHDKQWSAPAGIRRVVRVWPDGPSTSSGQGKGYDVEAVVPLDCLGMAPLVPGQLLRFDWDIVYGKPEGGVSYKLAWNAAGNELLYDPRSWAFARCIAGPGREKDVHVVRRSSAGGEAFTDWDRVPDQARVAVEEAEDQYAAHMKVACDDEFLAFEFRVADPDPALVTPSMNWIGAGDYIELHLDGKRVNAPAGPAFTVPYLVHGAEAREIEGARQHVAVADRGKAYRLELVLPWSALGGRRESLSFNWTILWSDPSGGSAFGQRWYCAPDKPARLVLDSDAP